MDTISKPNASRRFANLKAFGLLAVAGTVIAVGVVYQSSVNSKVAANCVCSTSSSYNPSLPASHPSNRCANQAQDLSWQSWLTGSSRTTQFHFLDLLELLQGSDNKPTERPTASQH